MKENIENAIAWIKEQPVKGCITGSSLLGTFEGSDQDVDVFVYEESDFKELFYAMYYSKDFQILDPIEKWKSDKWRFSNSDFYKFGLITIKFDYNTCVPVNIILKKKCQDIFSVLSSFDLDIVSVGYDLQSKQTLNLSQNLPDKQATWNRWNKAYHSNEVWEISRILRQLERVFKYHKRGYNTDLVVKKYMELIDKVQESVNIFSSERYSEKLEVKKENTRIVKKICELWLETHKITPEQLETLKQKIKEV